MLVKPTTAEKYFEIDTSANLNTAPLNIPRTFDTDKYNYTFFFRHQAQILSPIELVFNADQGVNYRNYVMYGSGATAAAAVNDLNTLGVRLTEGSAQQITFSKTTLISDVGRTALCDTLSAGSFFQGGGRQISKRSAYWNNTANITAVRLRCFFDAGVFPYHLIVYRYPKEGNQSNWEFLQQLTFAGAGTQNFTGLNGIVDGQYKMVWNEAAQQNLTATINGDASAIYTRLQMSNAGGTIGMGFSTTLSNIDMLPQTTAIINADAGLHRQIALTSSKTTSTQQNERSYFYRDPNTNITSISCSPLTTANGTIKLYRAINKNLNGELPWELIGESILNNQDFTGGLTVNVDGSANPILKFEYVLTGGVNLMRHSINGDVVEANYPAQTLVVTEGDGPAAGAIGISSIGTGISASSRAIGYFYIGASQSTLITESYRQTNSAQTMFKQTNHAGAVTSIRLYNLAATPVTGTVKIWRLP